MNFERVCGISLMEISGQRVPERSSRSEEKKRKKKKKKKKKKRKKKQKNAKLAVLLEPAVWYRQSAWL